jgi:Na+-translocating ferredoxin:NAD+ oxidoreductase RnfC subunit
MNALAEKVRSAGVVGAGGAGFPAYVKYNASADTVLANGAECEPLLYKDKELMRHRAEEITRGMNLVASAVGAGRRVLGIKAKNEKIVGQFKRIFGGTANEIYEMGDYYPAGDEYVLVYEATGRLIPYGGYPINIGCVVSNVETLLNVALAENGIPVTEKWITVTGAVRNPMTLRVPIGISIQECIDCAGGVSVSGEVAVLDGGAMMGKLVRDFNQPITKTSGGFIVLPEDHSLVRRRDQTMPEMKKIGQSACDQCSYCTEFCPRYLLGYQIEPHKVMRSLGFAGERDDFWGTYSMNCCECNLCSLFACPEDLDPKQACVRSKTNLRLKNLGYTPPVESLRAHPMQEHRKVSIERLTRKLGLIPYDHHADYVDDKPRPSRVCIPLSQHIGNSAHPVVKVGDIVTVGQLIGDVPADVLGAPVHASISGTVTEVAEHIIIQQG